MQEEKRKPEIRFENFDSNWGQYTINEISNVYDGVHQTPDYKDSGVMFLSVEDINSLISQKYISEESFKKDFKVYPQKGDILMTRIGDVGTTNVVETDEKLAFYVSLALLKPINVDSYFLSNVIMSPRFRKGLQDRTLVTAIPQKINKEEIGKVDVLMPLSTMEQTQIGSLFHVLEDIINLQKREYTQLVNMKSALLEKMFPCDGAKAPEIRLAGFTGDWERCELNRIVAIYDGTHQTPDYKNNGIMFLSVEDIDTLKSEKYISEEAFEKNFKIYPQMGDILMTRIGDVGTTNVVETDEKIAYYVSLALLKPINSDPFFVSNAIMSPSFQKNLKERTLTTAIPQKINKDEIGKVSISLPPTKEEQVKIGLIFKKFDNLITLQKAMINHIQNIKQSFLDKMFVS